MSDDRPLRACDICKQVDDHPRHAHYDTAANVDTAPDPDLIEAAVKAGVTGIHLAELLHPHAIDRHFDCCRDNGCPDGSCAQILAACGNLTGQPLIDFVTGGVSA